MTRKTNRPPVLSRFFRWLLPGRIGADACDDLSERREELRQRRGQTIARIWQLAHVLSPDTWRLAVALRRSPRSWEILTEIKHAFRSVAATPGFTVTVILTLSLGIGANISMLGIVDRLYFRPISLLRDPETVHRVYLERNNRQFGRQTSAVMQYGRFRDFRDDTTSFSAVATFSEELIAVGTGEATRERHVGFVSASYFSFFKAAPVLGRFFTADEDVPPVGARVAVLSHRYWQREFAGRQVVGETLDVGSIRTSIVGVAPEGFLGIDDANAPAVFVPSAALAAAIDVQDDSTFFGYSRFETVSMLVRRAPGVTVEDASRDINQAYQRSWRKEEASPTAANRLVSLDVAQPAAFIGPIRRAAGPAPLPEMRIAFWLTGLSFVVLIVACANVANLWLARAIQRSRETSIRIAIGAGRGRLTLQALTEATLLSLAGALGAMVVGAWGGSAVRRLLLPAADTSLPTFTDWRIGVITMVLALAVGLVCGGILALFTASRDPIAALTVRNGTASPRANRLRGALVIAQAACSVALLIGAALFVKSVRAVEAVPRGYSLDQVLVVNPVMRGTQLTAEQQRQLRQTLAEASAPHVQAVSWAGAAPLWRTFPRTPIVPGVEDVASIGAFSMYAVEAAYFDVMSTRVIRGRAFHADDRLGAMPVMLVGERMARALWPGEDPLGKCLHIAALPSPCVSIVGVTNDVMQSGQYNSLVPRFQYYVPIEQQPMDDLGFLLLRVRGDLAQEAEAAREQLQRLMPGTSYVTVEPMSELLEEAQRPWRLGARLFMTGGTIALLVAVIGLYGAVSHNISQRSRELALRLALGATRESVLRMVLRQAARLTAAGVVLGTIGAALAGRWLEPLLFRQQAIDGTVYATVGLFTLMAAIATCLPAAIRAAAADPVLVLRGE